MVYRYFLPANGGGWFRRYTNFQQQIVQRVWRTRDVHPFAPVTLFDFSRRDDAADIALLSSSSSSSNNKDKSASRKNRPLNQHDSWRLSDDRVIGGYSESWAHLIRPSPEQETAAATTTTTTTTNNNVVTRIEDDNEENGDDETQDAAEYKESIRKRPFLRWYGNLDTTIGLESSVQRSGFCALRSPTFSLGGANLRGAYTALEVTCRTDGRVYTINLQVTTGLPDDIFQGQIDVVATEPGKFDKLYLPFAEFGFVGVKKGRGGGFAPRKVASRFIDEEGTEENDDDDYQSSRKSRNSSDSVGATHHQEHFRRRRSVRQQQQFLEIGASEEDQSGRLDGKICIESIGFTLMDKQDGPFQFDLASIRAVNFYEDEVWEGVPPGGKENDAPRFRL